MMLVLFSSFIFIYLSENVFTMHRNDRYMVVPYTRRPYRTMSTSIMETYSTTPRLRTRSTTSSESTTRKLKTRSTKSPETTSSIVTEQVTTTRKLKTRSTRRPETTPETTRRTLGPLPRTPKVLTSTTTTTTETRRR